jgi:hypothetical protein
MASAWAFGSTIAVEAGGPVVDRQGSSHPHCAFSSPQRFSVSASGSGHGTMPLLQHTSMQAPSDELFTQYSCVSWHIELGWMTAAFSGKHSGLHVTLQSVASLGHTGSSTLSTHALNHRKRAHARGRRTI